MTYNLLEYHLLSKSIGDSEITLIFQHLHDPTDKMIFQLGGVAGFVDLLTNDSDLQVLRIDDHGGSYSFDLSLRSKNIDIRQNKELFLFSDEACTDFQFKASMKSVVVKPLRQTGH